MNSSFSNNNNDDNNNNEGGRGLISIEDCVNQAGILLETYVQSSEEEFLKAVTLFAYLQ